MEHKIDQDATGLQKGRGLFLMTTGARQLKCCGRASLEKIYPCVGVPLLQHKCFCKVKNKEISNNTFYPQFIMI